MEPPTVRTMTMTKAHKTSGLRRLLFAFAAAFLVVGCGQQRQAQSDAVPSKGDTVQNDVIRSQINEGFALAAEVKSVVEAYYRKHDAMPKDNASANIRRIDGTYVSAITIRHKGSIQISYNTASADKAIRGGHLILLPIPQKHPSGQAHSVKWRCVSLDIGSEFLPSRCVGAKPSDAVSNKGETVYLTLVAYNYTDHTISDYYVNGAWGANVAVSGETSGGSKSTCCVRWVVGQDLPVTAHIKWESHICSYKKEVDGQLFTRYRLFYSERDVQVTQATTNDPEYFETHFYPDGHIEVAVTSDRSKPRLRLPVIGGVGTGTPRQRPGAAPVPECTPKQLQDQAE